MQFKKHRFFPEAAHFHSHFRAYFRAHIHSYLPAHFNRALFFFFAILFSPSYLLSAEENETASTSGKFFVSFIGGATLQTSGSYIEHEERYNNTQNLLIATGQIRPSFYGIPMKNLYFESEKENGSSAQFDFEYAYSKRLGLGVTLHHFAIDIERQDVKTGVVFSPVEGAIVRQDYIFPVPEKEKLYQGTSVLFQMVFHPLVGSSADPYLAMRMGAVGYTGHAHGGLTKEPMRYDSKIKNGLGAEVGLAVGINFYLNNHFALRVETSAYRQFLQSSEFRYRGLTSSHLQLGILFRP